MPLGSLIFKFLKGRAFKPFETPLEKALERQMRMLSRKFKRMEGTLIGKKLGICSGVRLEGLPITEYDFYEPFFKSPAKDAFMYDIEGYERVRTSGTGGTEKWFMIPKFSLSKCWETGLASLIAMFHDGERVNFRCGDTVYVNVAPRPFLGGSILLRAGRGTYGIVRLVPNISLSFKDKVWFFIGNHMNIDGAVMLASTLVSLVMHEVDGRLSLKGLLTLDSQIADVYFDEIADFAGVAPKTAYGTTETLNCTIPSVEHRLGFIFDWRRGVFEFIPVEDDAVEAKRETLIPITEVEVGKTYQLVYTSIEGEITRYRIPDALTCVAKGDSAIGTDYPVFKFHSRLEKTISLQNFTRISEGEILSALTESKIPLVDFTARVQIDGGLEYLALFVECWKEISVDEAEKLVHNYFYKSDRDYRDLVDFFGYTPLKVHTLPRGSFSKYMEAKKASWGKVERINMREEDFRKLLSLR